MSLWEVTHQTLPIKMTFNNNNNHSEDISFYEYSSSIQPVVFPWFKLHNPSVNWITSEVSFHSDTCKSQCLKSITPPTLAAPVQIEPVHPDITTVPSCYHDLREVSKAKATSLPPHRPYDCGIDLLPGASPLRGRLYSLSVPKT